VGNDPIALLHIKRFRWHTRVFSPSLSRQSAGHGKTRRDKKKVYSTCEDRKALAILRPKERPAAKDAYGRRHERKIKG